MIDGHPGLENDLLHAQPRATETNVPRVSIVIPSWTGDVTRVLASIHQQTYRSWSVDVVSGVGPASRARNLGAARARGELLLFIDDDAFFGGVDVLQRMVDVLDRYPHVAVVGSSKLVPEKASWFQKAVARQVPRMAFPVLACEQESNPPLDAYGFSAATTTCCIVRRSVFEELGGFDEHLPTGPEDTDFFYRLRRSKYTIMIAAGARVYHDPPAGLFELLRKSFHYGAGHALEARKYPERRLAVLPIDRWYGKLPVALVPLTFPFALFIHLYLEPRPHLVFGFRPLKTFSTYAVLVGYMYGSFQTCGPPRPVTGYMGRARARSSPSGPGSGLSVDASRSMRANP